jgi:hypothetical protein
VIRSLGNTIHAISYRENELQYKKLATINKINTNNNNNNKVKAIPVRGCGGL